MAAHSSILAWRIPWTEESDGLQSMGSHRLGHDWSDLAYMHMYIPGKTETILSSLGTILRWARLHCRFQNTQIQKENIQAPLLNWLVGSRHMQVKLRAFDTHSDWALKKEIKAVVATDSLKLTLRSTRALCCKVKLSLGAHLEGCIF